MNDKARKILGGLSTASLIVAGTLPLMSAPCNSQCTRAKSKKVEPSRSEKQKAVATAEKAVEKKAPAKTTLDKSKSSK